MRAHPSSTSPRFLSLCPSQILSSFCHFQVRLTLRPYLGIFPRRSLNSCFFTLDKLLQSDSHPWRLHVNIQACRENGGNTNHDSPRHRHRSLPPPSPPNQRKCTQRMPETLAINRSHHCRYSIKQQPAVPRISPRNLQTTKDPILTARTTARPKPRCCPARPRDEAGHR